MARTDRTTSVKLGEQLDARCYADEAYWREVRTTFALTPDVVHLAGFWLSSHPVAVRQLIAKHRRALDRNPYTYVADNEVKNDWEVRRALAGMIGADATQIALTSSTTEGLSIVYGGLELGAGDEVLSTVHDHYSTHESLEVLRRRTGATVRRVACYGDGDAYDAKTIVDRLAAEIRPATRVLALTWVHSSTGVRLPVEAIGQAIQRLNRARCVNREILLVVDGTHGFGAFDLNVHRVGCAFFVACCHKWLYGPRGTGFFWGSPRGFRQLLPTIPTFARGALRAFMKLPGPYELSDGERFSPGGFCAFEHRWAVPAAVGLLSRIGIAAVSGRLAYLSSRLKLGITKCPYVGLVTPMSADLSGAIVCFEVGGLTPEEVVERLRQRKVIASVSPYPRRYARLTPAIYNSLSDVEAAAREVCTLGRADRR